MAEPSQIASLGDLTKPVTVLIEKIAAAIGVIYEPHQIVRKAKAEANAAMIGAESQIEITDLERRALQRVRFEESRKQENLERVTELALRQLTPEATPERVEDDWIVNFFDKCRLTSDRELQLVWSRVLAGEANAPGAFSRRTVNLLASLDKRDAEIFTALGRILLAD